jgi:pantoate--beta-alanine ligase
MEVFKNPADLRKFLSQQKNKANTVGFVPTMGALHKGHISLIDEARKENDLTVASIFVNPLQFNNPRDLELYPRTIEHDLKMLEQAGCELVFLPSVEDIYRDKPLLKMSFGSLEEVMEGRHRPGHFNGVGIIVSKLFHYVLPDRAYFGQKDLQQFAIIRQMVRDLSFPVSLKCCPIIREEDGLAMSSRNVRLSPEKRAVAPRIYQSLKIAEDSLRSGVEEARNAALSFLNSYPDIQPEYFEICDAETLQPIKDVKEHGSIVICIAAYLDGVRLIDNILISIRTI